MPEIHYTSNLTSNRKVRLVFQTWRMLDYGKTERLVSEAQQVVA